MYFTFPMCVVFKINLSICFFMNYSREDIFIFTVTGNLTMYFFYISVCACVCMCVKNVQLIIMTQEKLHLMKLINSHTKSLS